MKQFFTAIFLFIGVLAFAQPANDDCSGIIDLGVAPACPDSVFFTNVDATPSDIGFGNIPTCWNGGTVQNDVWFSFVTSDTIFDYTITVTGLTDGMGSDGLINPQIALYRGECQTDGLAELLCATAENGETVLELDAVGLTPNITYFIRINDFSATASPNWGTFQLCVDEIAPINTIDEDGSSACSGELYDSGGPDGDYENNEDNIFTICPSDFTNCITFTLSYYNIEVSDFFPTDQLIFYDGDEADPSTIIGQIGGADFTSGGGGGVCYEVQASSGCLTVQFISDGTNTFEGFAGAWECSANECEQDESITVEGGISEDQIVDFISSPQTTVEITDINCPDNAYGLFEAGDNTNLGLERGLLLTSGDLNWAPGPNNDGGGGNFNADNFAPGDPDLDYLSAQSGNGSLSQDACIVELDVVAATNELVFEYVFGSEEYPEFVNQEFNDIFAFFISGPGIAGDPNINNQLNIAVLPDGNDTPVQINSVNNINNWEYYRDNENGLSTQYDGLTSDFQGIKKSLTARAEVLPCSTYHLKLAIADRFDGVWDSGVFISELRGGTPDLSIQFNSGVDFLIEDCTSQPDELIIELSSPLDVATTYNVIIGGTATIGLDYLLDIPASITFNPGETMLTFPITVLSDLLTEDTEIIEISLVNDLGCGEVTFATLEVELRDDTNIEILSGQDTVLVCQDSSIVLEVSGAATYFWTPVTVFDDPSSPNPLVTPNMSMWVFVEGNIGPCSDMDSIYLELIDPQIEITALDPTEICEGDSVRLEVIDNVDNINLQWTPEEGLSDPNSPNPLAQPAVTTTYIASVDNFGCVVSDTVTITVDPFDFPELISDTTICQNSSIQLATLEDTTGVTTTFSWTPVDGLNDPNSPTPIATPDVTTTYTLIATSASDACADTSEVTITVLPANIEIQEDSIYICLGETATLNAITSTGDAMGLEWFPNDGSLSDTTGLSVIATPDETTTYIATFEIGICLVSDTIVVQVDSIPNSEITADPEKDPYCTGEIVTLSSPTYEPSFFPEIEHIWTPATGLESPDSLWNLVFTTVETTTYQRITTNNACVDTSSIQINVVVPPILTIVPADTVICSDEMVNLQVTAEDPADLGMLEELMWTPEDNLSCTDCLNPTASPNSTTTYQFSADFMGCPTGAAATINVASLPVVSMNTDPTVCLGSSVQLNLASDPVSDYVWTSPDDPNFMSTEPELFVSPTQTTTYVLMATNPCGSIEEQITVTIVGQGMLESIEDQTICEGDLVSLTANGSAENASSETYTWTWPGNSETGQELSTNAITQNTQVTLTYTYGTSTETCGTITEQFTVTVSPAPGLLLPDPAEICFGDSIILNLDPDGNTTYSWTSPDDPNFSSSDSAPQVSPNQTITYSVTAETPGCPVVEEDLTVIVVPDVTMSLPDDITICAGDPVSIAPINSPEGNYSEIFDWLVNGASASSDPVLNLNDLNATSSVQLNYTYGPNCGTVEDSMTVIVEQAAVIDSFNVFDLPSSNEVPQGTVLNFDVILAQDIAGVTYQWTADGVVITGESGPTLVYTVTSDVTIEVTITTPSGCVTTQSVSITATPPIIDVPNAFTPDNDGDNDFFNLLIEGAIDEVLEFKIYNRWGQLVYDNEDQDNGWDGTFNGKEQPSDVYIYNITVKLLDDTAETLNFKGDVTLLK